MRVNPFLLRSYFMFSSQEHYDKRREYWDNKTGERARGLPVPAYGRLSRHPPSEINLLSFRSQLKYVTRQRIYQFDNPYILHQASSKTLQDTCLKRIAIFNWNHINNIS